jgi:hypothetical protein
VTPSIHVHDDLTVAHDEQRASWTGLVEASRGVEVWTAGVRARQRLARAKAPPDLCHVHEKKVERLAHARQRFLVMVLNSGRTRCVTLATAALETRAEPSRFVNGDDITLGKVTESAARSRAVARDGDNDDNDDKQQAR